MSSVIQENEDGASIKGTSINCLCPLALSPVQNQGVFSKPGPGFYFRGPIEKAQRRV